MVNPTNLDWITLKDNEQTALYLSCYMFCLNNVNVLDFYLFANIRSSFVIHKHYYVDFSYG